MLVSALKHANTKLSLSLYSPFRELYTERLIGFVFRVLLMLTIE